MTNPTETTNPTPESLATTATGTTGRSGNGGRTDRFSVLRAGRLNFSNSVLAILSRNSRKNSAFFREPRKNHSFASSAKEHAKECILSRHPRKNAERAKIIAGPCDDGDIDIRHLW